MAAFEAGRLREDGADPRPRRRDRRGPGHRRGAEAVVPPVLQAAVLPRRVPADVQPPERHARRHRRQGRRAHHRDRRRRRPGSSTRSTASSTPPASRSAPPTPAGPATTSSARRRDAVREVGRRPAHAARHARARLPELLHRAAAQGANLTSNFPHNLDQSRRTSPTSCGTRSTTTRRGRGDRRKPRRRGSTSLGSARLHARLPRACTPGYYNNEGQDRGRPPLSVASPPAPPRLHHFFGPRPSPRCPRPPVFR